jgi:hypothetical protein
MVWVPTAKVSVENVATPWAFSGAEPILTPSSSKATLPVGVVVRLPTRALKVAVSPARVVVVGELKVVVVAADCTTSTRTAEVLGA